MGRKKFYFMFSENYLVLFAPCKVFYFYVISQISRAKHSSVDICHAQTGLGSGLQQIQYLGVKIPGSKRATSPGRVLPSDKYNHQFCNKIATTSGNKSDHFYVLL